jgi:hypothetical protein
MAVLTTQTGSSAGERQAPNTGWPLSDVLAGVEPVLPDFLSRTARDWCVTAAAQVPGSAVAHYLECRPGQSEQVDVLSCFRSKDACAEHVRAYGGSNAAGPVWRRNLELLQQWSNEGSLLSQAPCVWFEYDAPQGPEREPFAASPSLGLEPNYEKRHQQALPGLAPRALELATAALDLLLTETEAAAAQAVVARCFAALPPAGAVGYVSVMTARKPVTTKLYVIVPRGAVVGFLTSAGWPGDVTQVSRVIDQLYPSVLSTAYLDLSITGRLESRLGIATSQFHKRELDSERAREDWPLIPPALREHATPLSAWPGFSSAVVAGRNASIQRFLDLKAVVDGDWVEHKAYLGFRPCLPPAFG